MLGNKSCSLIYKISLMLFEYESCCIQGVEDERKKMANGLLLPITTPTFFVVTLDHHIIS